MGENSELFAFTAPTTRHTRCPDGVTANTSPSRGSHTNDDGEYDGNAVTRSRGVLDTAPPAHSNAGVVMPPLC